MGYGLKRYEIQKTRFYASSHKGVFSVSIPMLHTSKVLFFDVFLDVSI